MERKISCIVVDDEPLAMELIAGYVRKVPFLELLATSDNPLEAIPMIKEKNPDLLFLDIQMPEINGIELAHLLSESSGKVVFITAFGEYALEGFRVNAVDYLLKPVSFAEFINSVQKVKKIIDVERIAAGSAERVGADSDNSNSFFVKTDYKLLQIKYDEILYIEGLKDYIKIYTDDQPRPVISRMSMKSVEEILPEKDFIRVHRSYIVRKDKIKIIERNRIIFGKEHIPVSDSYKDSFNAFLSSRGVV